MSRGIPGLRRAQAALLARRFGVELDPETEVVRHPRLQGRARQPRPGDHRTRRRDPGAEPELPDPPLRLHHRRRRDPPRAGRCPAAICCAGSAARSSIGAVADRAGAELPVQPDGQVVDLDFYKEVVAFARRHEIFILSDLAYAEIYFDDSRRPRSCRCRAPRTSRSSSPRCARPTTCRAGASASRPATDA